MNSPFIIPALMPALPEIVLAVGALILVLVGVFAKQRAFCIVTGGAIVFLGLALVLVILTPDARVVTFNGAFVSDAFSKFMKSLSLIGSIAALVMSGDYMRRNNIAVFEFPLLVMLATIGMLMVVSANSLIALYVGLELFSLSSYVIAALHRDNMRSSEAGLKYFVLGALSSGMLLYGSSLVYGFAGSVGFAEIAKAVSSGNPGLGIIVGLVFISAGLAFKISAVPFHMWTPDVYEGAPTPVTAFFASAPKMAAMAMAVRVYITAFPGITPQWQQIIVFISILSMVLGAFAAIGQKSIKRLMAYSSIANVGFALVGLATGTLEGVQGVVFYMAIYLAMTVGTFACILSMRRDGVNVEQIEDLSGIGKTNPGMAFCLAMLMFSMAGIPPLAGFFAKFVVFSAAIKAGTLGLTVLAVIGVLASVVGAYYYLRIVKVMYFDESKLAFDNMSVGVKGVLAVSFAVVFLFGLWPAPLVNAATVAAQALFRV